MSIIHVQTYEYIYIYIYLYIYIYIWSMKWQPTPVFLPGESPWTEEPGGLQSRGSQRVRHDWVTGTSRQVSNGDWGSRSWIWVVSLCIWEMDSILFSYSHFVRNAQGDLREMWQQQPSAVPSLFLPCRHMGRRFLCWPPTVENDCG